MREVYEYVSVIFQDIQKHCADSKAVQQLRRHNSNITQKQELDVV
jgi:hypothetical protein